MLCLVVGLGLGFGLGTDLVCGWLMVMHTYVYYSRLSPYRANRGVIVRIQVFDPNTPPRVDETAACCWTD